MDMAMEACPFSQRYGAGFTVFASYKDRRLRLPFRSDATVPEKPEAVAVDGSGKQG
jgi:hypothetical protein